MNDLNKVTISGRLTRDPEVKFTPSGTAICNLSVAVNKSWKDKNTGEKREQTSFVDVGLFQGQAEFAGKFCFKGQRIIVSGELKQEQWEDKNTGQKRSRLSLNSNEIIPIDWPERDGDHGQPQQQRPQGNPAPHTSSAHAGQSQFDDDDIPF